MGRRSRGRKPAGVHFGPWRERGGGAPESVEVGKVYVTRGVAESVDSDRIAGLLSRHAVGDWGDVCEEDWETNQEALYSGQRLLSVYKPEGKPEVWVITEADRSVTTVLLPEEY
jgi:hypothetical protein